MFSWIHWPLKPPLRFSAILRASSPATGQRSGRTAGSAPRRRPCWNPMRMIRTALELGFFSDFWMWDGTFEIFCPDFCWECCWDVCWDPMGFHGIYGTYKWWIDSLSTLTRMHCQVLTCARNFGDDLGLSRNLEPPKPHWNSHLGGTRPFWDEPVSAFWRWLSNMFWAWVSQIVFGDDFNVFSWTTWDLLG